MSAYLFNNKRDNETNKLMGVIIFLVLSLVFTIVISISIFLVYFDDYMSIQKQYTALEEKLQKISVENYEKNSYYTRLNVELNEAKNEVNKLTLEKEVADKNIKLVSYFMDAVNKSVKKDIDKFLSPSAEGVDDGYKFPNNMVPGEFVLNDNLESGSVTYFHTEDKKRTNKYTFDLVLKDDIWYIDDFEMSEYKPSPYVLPY